MDSLDSLPLAAVVLHAAGIFVACLCRLSLGVAANYALRSALLALGIAISGYAISSAQQAFQGWAFSALTLGIMITAAVLHSRHDDADPILACVVAARQ